MAYKPRQTLQLQLMQVERVTEVNCDAYYRVRVSFSRCWMAIQLNHMLHVPYAECQCHQLYGLF